MFTNTVWIELIEKYRDELKDELKTAYRTACGHPSVYEGTKGEQCIILDKDENITHVSRKNNEKPSDIQNKEAIFVGCFEWFDPWLYEGNKEETILSELTESEKKEYNSFLEKTGYKGKVNETTLQEFSSNIYKRVTDNLIYEFTISNEDEVANMAIEQCIQELENFTS